MPTDVSIIIPLYNEVECAPHLIEELRGFVASFDRTTEIILVDDGSDDGTFETVRSEIRGEARDVSGDPKPPLPGARLAKLRGNAGQTAAMAAGLSLAQGDVIVFMDGDLQNDPRDIPKLLEKIDEGYHLVSGWRRDRKDRALTRKFPSWAANLLIGVFTGVRVRDADGRPTGWLHDFGCTLKAYRASELRALNLYSDMHRFLPALTHRAGAKIAEVVVNHRSREFGRSKYGLSRVLKVAADLVVLRLITEFAGRPMHYFGPLALTFVLFAGFTAAVWGWNLATRTGDGTIIFPAVITLFFVSSLYFLVLGLLAELIQRVGKYDPSDQARATLETI